jgi:hypothetical protein
MEADVHAPVEIPLFGPSPAKRQPLIETAVPTSFLGAALPATPNSYRGGFVPSWTASDAEEQRRKELEESLARTVNRQFVDPPVVIDNLKQSECHTPSSHAQRDIWHAGQAIPTAMDPLRMGSRIHSTLHTIDDIPKYMNRDVELEKELPALGVTINGTAHFSRLMDEATLEKLEQNQGGYYQPNNRRQVPLYMANSASGLRVNEPGIELPRLDRPLSLPTPTFTKPPPHRSAPPTPSLSHAPQCPHPITAPATTTARGTASLLAALQQAAREGYQPPHTLLCPPQSPQPPPPPQRNAPPPNAAAGGGNIRMHPLLVQAERSDQQQWLKGTLGKRTGTHTLSLECMGASYLIRWHRKEDVPPTVANHFSQYRLYYRSSQQISFQPNYDLIFEGPGHCTQWTPGSNPKAGKDRMIFYLSGFDHLQRQWQLLAPPTQLHVKE